MWVQRTYAGEDDPIFGTETYERGINFLAETCDTIEDWGCGMGYAQRFVPKGITWHGVDGSDDAQRFSRHGKQIIQQDLTEYTSSVDGIFMRHVLEHNTQWFKILRNAMDSFTKRFVLIMFTPFSEGDTRPMVVGPLIDWSFKKSDLTNFWDRTRMTQKGPEPVFNIEEEHLKTITQYGEEHIFYIERR